MAHCIQQPYASQSKQTSTKPRTRKKHALLRQGNARKRRSERRKKKEESKEEERARSEEGGEQTRRDSTTHDAGTLQSRKKRDKTVPVNGRKTLVPSEPNTDPHGTLIPEHGNRSLRNASTR